MNALYQLAQPFVWHPARALAVAAGWAVLGLVVPRLARTPLLVAAGAWGAFGLLEYLAWRERADIRVDLLVTWPALCLVTLGGVVAAGRRLARRP